MKMADEGFYFEYVWSFKGIVSITNNISNIIELQKM